MSRLARKVAEARKLYASWPEDLRRELEQYLAAAMGAKRLTPRVPAEHRTFARDLGMMAVSEGAIGKNWPKVHEAFRTEWPEVYEHLREILPEGDDDGGLGL